MGEGRGGGERGLGENGKAGRGGNAERGLGEKRGRQVQQKSHKSMKEENLRRIRIWIEIAKKEKG